MKHLWINYHSIVPGEPDEYDIACDNCGVSKNEDNEDEECTAKEDEED